MANSTWLDLSQTLEQERQLLRTLIDLMPDFIFFKDLQSRFLIVNQSLAKAYGSSPPEMTSRTDADFMSPEMAAKCRASELQVLAGKPLAGGEDTLRFPDGVSRTMITNMVPFRDAHGKVCGLAGIGHDITARKQNESRLKTSEFALKQAQHLSAIGSWSWDLVSGQSTWSEEMYRIFGVDPALPPLEYAKARKLFTPASWKHLSYAVDNAIAEGKPYECDAEVVRPDGRHCWITSRGEPTKDTNGKVIRLHGTIQDTTARKRSEQLLYRANRTLKAIRDCHEVMQRVGTEHELLDQICHIIVQTGGERMAWVGFAEHDKHKTIRPFAMAGALKDYLSKARITWADTTRGHGPVGTAIRTGKVCICHNTQTDPDFAPWRESARRQGYGSVIALPLIVDDQCIGALCIYAPEPDVFDAAEQQLLADLANDLAFGISMLRLKADRERLQDEVLRSIESEQERIGRDLHDSLCQLLVGAKFRSAHLKTITRDQLPEAAREAGALEDSLNYAIQQTRELARGLNPIKCTPAGLPAALGKFAEDVDRVKGPHCFCHIPEPVEIPEYIATDHLYRIAQEAVQNALKHARAKNISISLLRRVGKINLVIKDDGRGMPVAPKRPGMGLKNMQTRARLIGGRLIISRRKQGGTSVTCEVSLTAHHPP